MWTIVKAARAPKLIKEATVSNENTNDDNANRLTITVLYTGVLYLGEIYPNIFLGRIVSRPIANRSLDTLAWELVADAKQPNIYPARNMALNRFPQIKTAI